MRRLFPLFCLVALAPLARGADDTPTPKVKPARDTTYVTGPLTKEGYIDYETALNERLSKGIKAETNANVALYLAFGPKPEGAEMPADYYKWMGVKAPAEKGDYFVSYDKYLREHLQAEREEMQQHWDNLDRAGVRPWVAKDHPEIVDWLTTNEKPLKLIVAATAERDYFNPLVSRQRDGEPGTLIGALLPTVQRSREAASALKARAMLLIGEGEFDAAWQDLLACHRLARLIARGGTIIESLVGIAIDHIAANADLALLDQPKLSAKQARACLKDLQALPPLPALADKVDLTERFMFLDGVQAVRKHGYGFLLSQPGPMEADPQREKALAAIDWESVMRAGNKWYDRLAKALRIKDRPEREKELGQIEKDVAAARQGGDAELEKLIERLKKDPTDKEAAAAVGEVMVKMLLPAVKKVQQASDRDEQVSHNLQVAFALAAYQRDTGKYPDKLEALAPKYLAEVPGDVFSGKALKYQPGKDGYLLYSVGVNGKDEDGRWYDDKPPGDDPRVRLPLPPLKDK